MGTPPITAQIRLVLVMPNQPAAMFEIFRGRVLQVRQDFRKAADTQEPVGFNTREAWLIHWIDHATVCSWLLKLSQSAFVVRRIGKHQINTSIVQRSQPINRIALKQLAVRVFVLELEAFGNRLKAKLFAIGGSADVVDIL